MSAPGISENFPPSLTQEQLAELFPLGRPPIKPKSYEVGLVLAGTVSAGAYTAGVLDFMLEALDAWTLAKQKGDANAPTHDVVLSTIAGASGGAINGAILTRVASFGFPHGPVSGNPFYDIWVNGVTISDLLAPDNPVRGLASLFNTARFAQLADDLVTKPGPDLGGNSQTPVPRGYLADPLRLFMMVANVTGIPYRINFQGETKLGHDLVGHADYVRFGLTVPGGVDNRKVERPDEFPLSFASATNWDLVSAAALSTSAFPAAFPSRALVRNLESLGYRVAVVPGEDQNTAEIAQLVPNWSLLLEDGKTPGRVRSVNVDGGTVNNQPLDFARMELAGYNGRNPRSGKDAFRGVVLVDPFSDPATISPFDPPGFLDLLGPLVSTLVYQARFKPEDIALAVDDDTYSRFLVTPLGVAGGVTKVSAGNAIAAGGLGGFLGFVDRSLLDYDFKLGRRNAYEFLKQEFVLPSSNALFDGTWSGPQIQSYQTPDSVPAAGKDKVFLPIIPVMPDVPVPTEPTAQDWPRLSAVPTTLSDQVAARLDSIYAGLKDDLTSRKVWPGSITGSIIGRIWNWFLRGTLRSKVVGTFQQALNDQNLLPVTVQSWPLTDVGNSSAKAAQTEWLAANATSSVISSDAAHWILTTTWP